MNNKFWQEFLDMYPRAKSATMIEYTSTMKDGTIVKVKVDLDRVGIAINFTNPDGTPHYAINTSVKLSIIPKNKKFSVEKKSVKGKQSSPPNQMFS